jgi:hypothetical protein
MNFDSHLPNIPLPVTCFCFLLRQIIDGPYGERHPEGRLDHPHHRSADRPELGAAGHDSTLVTVELAA